MQVDRFKKLVCESDSLNYSQASLSISFRSINTQYLTSSVENMGQVQMKK